MHSKKHDVLIEMQIVFGYKLNTRLTYIKFIRFKKIPFTIIGGMENKCIQTLTYNISGHASG